MTEFRGDVIEAFYDRHPYPPPITDLDAVADRAADALDQRVAHHLVWPERPHTEHLRVLVAGCGTTQAARHAILRPHAEVVGIDVSPTSVEHSRRLARRHGLTNPRDRAYAVPELLELLTDAGLRFGRWTRQASYLPDCGSISETPLAARIAALPVPEQFAALELFRGTIARHTVIAFAAGDTTSGRLDFTDPRADRWRPIRVPTAIAVQECLPPGAAAALLNGTHSSTDLVMFVDRAELEVFRRIDGERTIAALGTDSRPFVERLFRHDLVVIDASAEATS